MDWRFPRVNGVPWSRGRRKPTEMAEAKFANGEHHDAVTASVRPHASPASSKGDVVFTACVTEIGADREPRLVCHDDTWIYPGPALCYVGWPTLEG